MQEAFEEIFGEASDFLREQIEGVQAAIQLAETVRDAFYQAADDIKGFLEEAITGELSGVSLQEQLSYSRDWYEDAKEKAIAGDADAANDITKYAEMYMAATKATMTDPTEYRIFFGRMQTELNQLQALFLERASALTT